MLNLAHSNFRHPSQIAFLGLHGIGTIFGLAYNSRTPNLYPQASHKGLGWALSGLICTCFVIEIVRDTLTRSTDVASSYERAPFIDEAIGLSRMEEERDVDQQDGILTPRGASPSSELSRFSLENDSQTLLDAHLPYRSRPGNRYIEPITWSRRWATVSGSGRLVRVLDLCFAVIDPCLLILGFVAICTGTVTMAGIFVRTSS